MAAPQLIPPVGTAPTDPDGAHTRQGGRFKRERRAPVRSGAGPARGSAHETSSGDSYTHECGSTNEEGAEVVRLVLVRALKRRGPVHAPAETEGARAIAARHEGPSQPADSATPPAESHAIDAAARYRAATEDDSQPHTIDRLG